MKNIDITVIITVWKRPYLDRQLRSLTKQSMPPKYIWIIHNENHIDIKATIDKYSDYFPNIKVIDSDLNLKYFGRFSLCYHVKTTYTLIIDDDVIPSLKWLQICIETCNKYNAVISCTGRILRPNNYRPEELQPGDILEEVGKKYFIGDCYNDLSYNFSPNDTQVDYGCNSYFLKTKWIKYFWSFWPATFDSGEDIHLSAALMIAKSIPTYVPQQLSLETTGNLKKDYSADQYSSWLKRDFIDIRQSVFQYFIKEKKWCPMLWKKVVLT